MDRIKRHSGARLTPKLGVQALTPTLSMMTLNCCKNEIVSSEGADPFLDAYGVERNAIRVKWWDEQAQALQALT